MFGVGFALSHGVCADDGGEFCREPERFQQKLGQVSALVGADGELCPFSGEGIERGGGAGERNAVAGDVGPVMFDEGLGQLIQSLDGKTDPGEPRAPFNQCSRALADHAAHHVELHPGQAL